MTFSQRMGIAKVRDAIQVESLDKETRNAIWNLISPVFQKAKECAQSTMFKDIWTDLYQKASDTVPRDGVRPYDDRSDEELYCRYVRGKVIEGKWHECLDLVEFLASSYYRKRWDEQFYDNFSHRQEIRVPNAQVFNVLFEAYMVGYRFVGEELTPITNEHEVAAIETSINNTKPAVQELLSKAVMHLSDRKHPDYAKSVECSISAVEAQCCILLGGAQASLGQALKELEKKGVTMHPALKGAFEKLYGYTSNADGIRHAGIRPSDVDQALAKYMLVSCSAFVGYLISKS